MGGGGGVQDRFDIFLNDTSIKAISGDLFLNFTLIWTYTHGLNTLWLEYEIVNMEKQPTNSAKVFNNCAVRSEQG